MRGLDTASRFLGSRARTSTRFKSIGTKGKDLSGEAGLEEHGFVARYSRGGRLGRGSHHHSPNRVRDCCKI